MDLFFQHGRMGDWITSSVILALALVMAMPGETVAEPGFAGFVVLGFDDAALGAGLALVAAMRIAGLWINGRWRRSPLLRCIGAIAGAGLFLGLAVAFALPYVAGWSDTVSTAVGTYLLLSIADVIAAYRSAADASLYQRG